jgi:hypothetical protein
MFLFYKTSYLNEEVNCTESSLAVRVPWFFTVRQFQPSLIFAVKAEAQPL